MEPLTIFTLAELLGLVTGAIGYRIAESRGRPGAEGFWLGFFLNFLGIIIELLLPRIERTQIFIPEFEQPQVPQRGLRLIVNRRERPFRECPFCAEIVLAEASVCRFCKGNLLAAGRERSSDTSRTGVPKNRYLSVLRSGPGEQRTNALGSGAAGTRARFGLPRRGSANPRRSVLPT